MNKATEEEIRDMILNVSMKDIAPVLIEALNSYVAKPTKDVARTIHLTMSITAQRLMLETEGLAALDAQNAHRREANELLEDKQEDQSIADMLDEALGE